MLSSEWRARKFVKGGVFGVVVSVLWHGTEGHADKLRGVLPMPEKEGSGPRRHAAKRMLPEARS